jgi:hypothetical protein
VTKLHGKTKVKTNYPLLEHPYLLLSKWLACKASTDLEIRSLIHDASNFLCICCIHSNTHLNYILVSMFQNSHVGLVSRGTGDEYQNMWFVIFKRECVIIVCL